MSTESKVLSGYEPYYDAIRSTLLAACSIVNAPSSTIERQNIPEIEEGPNEFMTPLMVSKDKDERVLIEPSANAVRVSVQWKKADPIDQLLTRTYTGFMTQRAGRFLVLRRKPIPGYDISFLICNQHIESMLTHKLVDWIISFLTDITSDLTLMKIEINQRSRAVAKLYFNDFA